MGRLKYAKGRALSVHIAGERCARGTLWSIVNLVDQKTLSVEDSAGYILFEVIDRLCLGRNEALNQITNR